MVAGMEQGPALVGVCERVIGATGQGLAHRFGSRGAIA
jgi:hypothetical protein